MHQWEVYQVVVPIMREQLSLLLLQLLVVIILTIGATETHKIQEQLL